ncbi:MAG: right-handed parallel beta-helix repeat-containing protein, partial [Elusimicrobia bacterium]|nr:right-handed parallel beta-helix repeat-containing protein [Elusimicrobiota bacterium]
MKVDLKHPFGSIIFPELPQTHHFPSPHPTLSRKGRGDSGKFCIFLAVFFCLASANPLFSSDVDPLPPLTQKLLETAKRYEAAASSQDKNVLLGQLISIASSRRESLREAIRSGELRRFLSQSISADVRDSLPQEIRPLIEEKGVKVEGRLEVSIAEDFANRKSEQLYHLESRGKKYRVHFAQNSPPLLSGSEVVAYGTLLDSEFVVQDGKQPAQFKTSPSVKTSLVSGDIRTVALLFNFANNPNNRPFTTNQINSTLFTSSTSVNQYYQETSFGQVSFSGDVLGWYTIPYNLGATCDSWTWSQAADAAATAAGVDLSQYQKRIYFFPNTNVCGWGGMGQLGGALSWNNGYDSMFVFAHELGHNLGIHHAEWLKCGAVPVDNYSNCTTDEYGDLWDIMGWLDISESQFNAPHKAALGWIPPQRIQTASTNGVYSIAPLEVSTEGIQALKIPKANTNEFYYLEYRQPIGLDAPLRSGITRGALIHIWNDMGFSQTKLVDTTPLSDTSTYDLWKSRDVWDASLGDGASFQDPAIGLSVTQISHDASSVTVSVTLNCNPSAPLISIYPANPMALDGSTASYTVSLSNRDSPFCPTTRFNLTSGLPADWNSQINPLFLDVPPLQYRSANLIVTVPSGTIPGTYLISIQAADGSNPIHTSSAAAALTVLNLLSSTRSGNWSDPFTWDRGRIPSPDYQVLIQAGHTITLDTTTATAGRTTLQGTLSFSRISDSRFAMVRGDLIVNPGGVLDMGTELAPISPSLKATLILSSGSYAGQYSLTVQRDGTFTLRGARKTSSSTATEDALAGASLIRVRSPSLNYSNKTQRPFPDDLDPEALWSVGDEIVISQTDLSSQNHTERRTISSLSGTDPLLIGFSPPLLYDHSAASTATVFNLTRNVEVRSAGSVPTEDASYIRNFAESTANFSLAYGEFVQLGSGEDDAFGIILDGSQVRGVLSHCTIRDGYGIFFNQASGSTLNDSLIYSAYYNGVYISNSHNNILTDNASFSNGGAGFFLDNSSHNTFVSNDAFSNPGYGIVFLGTSASSNILKSNRVHSNMGYGIALMSGSYNILTDNSVYSNSSDGVSLWSGSGNLLIANFIYSNSGYGMFATFNSNQNTAVEDLIGYDPSQNPRPNGKEEIALTPLYPADLTLKSVRINPTRGISTAGFNRDGNYLLSYNQSGESGTARLWGDYTLSNASLILDETAPLYRSTATVPQVMRGAGHSASVLNTQDTSAVSQIITIQRYQNYWIVEGSRSGPLGSFSGSISYQPFPPASPQFFLSFNEGGFPQEGDVVSFALLGDSRDANSQKKLLFGPSDFRFRGGRSRFTIAPSAEFRLMGSSLAPSVMDRMDPAVPYYTFVDSGAFVLSYSTITNVDESGIQLSGTAGVSLSSSTFDLAGQNPISSTSTYITLRNLTSQATFYGLVFNSSRSQASLYNIRVQGTNPGLNWTLKNWRGAAGGEAYEDDALDNIRWASPYVVPPANLVPSGTLFARTISSVTLSWDPVPGAVGYAVRVQDLTDGSLRDPRNNCPDNTLYLCIDTGLTSTSLSLPVQPGHRYDWWVHTIDPKGWSDPTSAGFSVEPWDTTPPSVAILSPTQGAPVSGIVTVNVSASDAEGLLKVELYRDSLLLSSKTAGPFTFSWNTRQTSNGTHSLTARAYDFSQNISTHTITVTISNSGGGGGGPRLFPAEIVRSDGTSTTSAGSVGGEGGSRALMISPAAGYDQSLVFGPEVVKASIVSMSGHQLFETESQAGSQIVIPLQRAGGRLLCESGLVLVQMHIQEGDHGKVLAKPMLCVK